MLARQMHFHGKPLTPLQIIAAPEPFWKIEQCYLKRGPRIAGITITWELVTKAKATFQALPQTSPVRMCPATRLPGDSSTY